MSLHVFIDFKPAEIKGKKEKYISYYAKSPFTGEFVRRKIRLNHIKNKSERLKFAKKLCIEINNKLYSGWSPFLQIDNATEKRIVLIDAINYFIQNKEKELRSDTMRSYVSFCNYLTNYLKSKNATMYIDEFSKVFAQDILDRIYRQENISALSYNNYLRFYKLLFNFFITCEYISVNPFQNIRTKKEEEKRRKTIPPAVRQRIKEHLLNGNKKEFYCMCMLTYKCFIRPKEILMLKLKNIDWDEKILHLPSDITKTGHERYVNIPEEVFEYFKTIRNYGGNNHIFSKDYKPGKILRDSKAIGKTWNNIRKELQLPKFYQFYSLKDTGITEMLEAGVPPKIVQDIAGHHSLEQTQKYTHKSDIKEIAKYNVLDF